MENDEVFEGPLDEFLARIAGPMSPTEVAAVHAVFGTMLALGETHFDTRMLPNVALKDVQVVVVNVGDGSHWAAEIISVGEDRGTLQ